MDEPGITPHTSLECELRWLRQQRIDHLAELELAADHIAELTARCDRYALDQAALILDARRADHPQL